MQSSRVLGRDVRTGDRHTACAVQVRARAASFRMAAEGSRRRPAPSDYAEHALELDDELPLLLGQGILEVLLQRVDRLAREPRVEHRLRGKVAAEDHIVGRIHLDGDALPFARLVHGLLLLLNAHDAAEVDDGGAALGVLGCRVDDA